MAALPRATTNWKEDAITRAEGITDAWEITKVYAGRLAEWVLFVCMIANIIEILPGVEVAGWLANTILGIQAVTLDIAGFGLATMAEQARINRETDAARRAKSTAYLLIGLMMITVLSLSVGTLWHEAKTYTDGADKLLILIRVVMTVVYGHVLHGLRQHSMKVIPMPVIEERLTMLSQRVAELRMPEPVNYVTLAAHIVPLLPQPEMPDYEHLVSSVAQQIMTQTASKQQEMTSALAALQAQLEVMAGATKTQLEEEAPNSVDITDCREEEGQQVRTEETKVSPRSATATTPAKQKAQRILKRTPGISATDLAKKAGISRQYASKIIAENAS